jgi:hypothetical protein
MFRSVVCLCVCVCHVSELSKHGSTDGADVYTVEPSLIVLDWGPYHNKDGRSYGGIGDSGLREVACRSHE